jgi:hypothetical protein
VKPGKEEHKLYPNHKFEFAKVGNNDKRFNAKDFDSVFSQPGSKDNYISLSYFQKPNATA